MIKGALFTIGILVALACGGFGVIAVMADGMSDNPEATRADHTPAACGVGVLIGVGMIIGSCFI